MVFDMAHQNLLVSCLLFLTTAAALTAAATHYEANWKSLDSRPLPGWFDKAKVGIFLHWGVFSVPSFNNEWFWYNWRTQKAANYEAFMKKNYKPDFTYEEFAPGLTAEFYEPEKWAELFKKAGAKYVVLTSKHHEGYTMWPSKYSFSWNVMDVGPKRDLLGDLATAVRHHNLTFGLYHSLYEWYNPMYLADKKNGYKTNEFVTKKIRPEMEEVVKAYKPSVIWSDGDWEAPDSYWNSTDFLAWLYNESPVKDEVVVNDRWGQGTSCKHGGFFNCADRYFPGTLLPHKWENAMTVDKHSWGYRREAPLTDYQTPEELIATVVKTVSCGGNVLINVGPTKDGKIVPVFEERLLQLGSWLGVNGHAIYESNPWKHQNDTVTKDVWYTQRSGKVYGTATFYPSSGSIEFGAIPYNTVKSVSLLGYPHSSLPFTQSGKGAHVVVAMPHLTPLMNVKYAYVFEFELK